MALRVDGTSTGPNIFSKAGQSIYEYETEVIFILENELFHTAGHHCWPEKLGKLDVEGIGLNPELYKNAIKKASKGKEFIVYDTSTDQFYILNDLDTATKNAGKYTVSRRELMVTPVDAYQKKDREEMPRSIQKLVERKKQELQK